MKIFNLACAKFHNLSIVGNDPCNPRWCLTVDKLELNCSNRDSNENATKIANWLWENLYSV